MLLNNEKNLLLVNKFINAIKTKQQEKTLFNTQLDALKEELSEMEKAIKDLDVIETLDGIGDSGFVLLSLSSLAVTDAEITALKPYYDRFEQLLSMLKINDELVDNLVYQVCVSNLSKFDENTSSARKTFEHYIGKDVNVYQVVVDDLYITKSSQEQLDNSGKHYYKDKVLKSVVNYTEPEIYQYYDAFQFK